MLKEVFIGIIGGTGLENPDIITIEKELNVPTPFGQPSDSIKVGTINGVRCAILPRHGRNHTISPTLVNYRANIFALKEIGCTHIIGTSACGSLKEEIEPGQIVIIDQFIDRTHKRHNTFYDNSHNGLQGVCHIPMNPPFCEATREILINATKSAGIKLKTSGTMIVVEGPRFSTKAESLMFKSWGGDVVGMTVFPEAVLARELGLCYASIALPTDYDCWREEKGGVDVESVMQMFQKHYANTITVLKTGVKLIAEKNWTKEWQEYEEMVSKAIMGT